MATATPPIRKQDLPPEGGYKKIPYLRVPPKSYMSGFQMIGAYVGITSVGLYVYYLTAQKIRREEIEARSAENVIFPILIAERDREFMKQLQRNRDEESKLMANVKGWEVGTWYGEPIYRTLPKDTLVTPMFTEFYGHTEYKHFAKRANIKLWT